MSAVPRASGSADVDNIDSSYLKSLVGYNARRAALDH